MTNVDAAFFPKNHGKLQDKAATLPVRYAGAGRFIVASGSEPGRVYTVATNGAHDPADWSCCCPWGERGGRLCSHVRAAVLEVGRQGERNARAARRADRNAAGGAVAA